MHICFPFESKPYSCKKSDDNLLTSSNAYRSVVNRSIAYFLAIVMFLLQQTYSFGCKRK